MKFNLKTLVHVSVLIAVEIVLSRFLSISTFNMKIGFGFLPIAICAMMYGPIWGAVAGGLADLLGAILFPIGPYFPGFTISAALTGLVFGLFLFRRGTSWSTLIGAVLVNCLVISLGISTFWISYLYGTPYFVLLPTRVLQCCVMIPLQVLVIRVMVRPVQIYSGKVGIT